MSQNCFFRIHYDEFCGDSEKNTHFFWIFGSNITGSRFFEIFRRCFSSGKIIKLDIKYKCEIRQLLGKCFVHTKHLNIKHFNIKIYSYLWTDIFFESEISKFFI
jgi:hypothetical protein